MYQFFDSEIIQQNELYPVETEVTTLSCMWNLASFPLAGISYGNMISPQFFSKSDAEPSWFLSLKNTNHNSKYISVYINMSARAKPQVRGKFRFHLYSNEGEEAKTDWTKTVNFQTHSPVGIEDFVEKDLLQNLSHNNLQILCEISYMINEYDFLDEGEVTKHKESKNELCQDLEYLLDSEKFCDVTFLLDGTEFRAHTAILAARSKIFAEKFEGREKNERIIITGMKCDSFREMLNFIYTGHVPNLKQFTGDLLAAACTYGLANLKLLCEQSLCDNLSVETAVATLILADKHKAYTLKTAAMDFINSNISEVMATEDWKEMAKTHCQLVFEAYEMMATKFFISNLCWR